jgi:sensor domain CHASE-containing protein
MAAGKRRSVIRRNKKSRLAATVKKILIRHAKITGDLNLQLKEVKRLHEHLENHIHEGDSKR